MLKGKGLLLPLQKRCLALWSTLPDQHHFYLTGGTALAEFYLGHRLSFDLDFFTAEEPLIMPASREAETVLATEGLQVSVVRRFASFVEMLVSDGVETLRVELALDWPYRLAPTVLSEYGIWVNDWLDLAVDKVLAYYGRAEPRDAVDLYFIFQQEQVERLLELAARKDPGFDLYWFAVALNRASEFPDRADAWPVTMLLPFEPPEIKRTFQRLALNLMGQVTCPPEEL